MESEPNMETQISRLRNPIFREQGVEDNNIDVQKKNIEKRVVMIKIYG